jgi:hypothetical protein
MIIRKCGLLQDRNRNPQFLLKENTIKKNETYLLTYNNAVNIMTALWGTRMPEDLETIELQEIYQQADTEDRKKIVEAAALLLNAQKSLENKPNDTLRNVNG